MLLIFSGVFKFFSGCTLNYISVCHKNGSEKTLAKAAVYAPASLLFIFSGSLVATHLLSNLRSIMGILFGLLSCGAFFRLHVEYAYVAILKWRDKSYWEEYVESEPDVGSKSDPMSNRQRKKYVRIAITVFEVILIFVLSRTV